MERNGDKCIPNSKFKGSRSRHILSCLFQDILIIWKFSATHFFFCSRNLEGCSHLRRENPKSCTHTETHCILAFSQLWSGKHSVYLIVSLLAPLCLDHKWMDTQTSDWCIDVAGQYKYCLFRWIHWKCRWKVRGRYLTNYCFGGLA